MAADHKLAADKGEENQSWECFRRHSFSSLSRFGL
jgi:hypothetical protein